MQTSTLSAPAPGAARRLRLDRDALHALREIANTALAVMHVGRDDGRIDELEALWSSEDDLAALLVGYLLGPEGAVAAAELRERADEHRARIETAGISPGGLFPFSGPGVEMEFLLANEPVRVAALEHHGREAGLTTGGALKVIELAPERALIRLGERVLMRAEHVLARDHGALRLELKGARWWYDRWTPRPHPAHGVLPLLRAREWALVDRPSAAVGGRLLPWLVGRGAHQGWPPRQRRLAELLCDSVSGVFEVCESEGDHAVFVSAEDGRSFAVFQAHPDGVEPGELVFGRLVPVGDGRYVESMATEVVGPEDEVDLERVQAVFAELRQHLPSAVAVEAAWTRGVQEEAIPRAVPPARDAEAAIGALAELREVLSPGGDDGTGNGGAAGEPGGKDALVEYVEALAALAKKRVPASRRKDGKKAKKRRR
jgi:hypothetical protein